MIPCGLDGVVMTSAHKETNKSYEMNLVKEQLTALVYRYLDCPSRGGES